ncbi:MAG: hypothetical protein HPM95_17580, partial [Alphaproteobacteria bacterium]|nr:hypothetical protein [Alphaproteobacteria bacterium]
LVLCIQPGSGDSLQFMKAGVMELPDLVAVTKADMGALARRAQADVAGALSLARPVDSDRLPDVLTVSATSGEGLGALVAACDAFGLQAERSGRMAARRAVQERHWVDDAIRRRFGSVGHGACDVGAALAKAGGPFSAIAAPRPVDAPKARAYRNPLKVCNSAVRSHMPAGDPSPQRGLPAVPVDAAARNVASGSFASKIE